MGSGAALTPQSHTRRPGCTPLGLAVPLPQRGAPRVDVEGFRFQGSRPCLSGFRSGSTLNIGALGQGYARLIPATNVRCQPATPIAGIGMRWLQRKLGP